MGVESSKEDKIIISRGDICLMKGDLSGAFQFFIQDGDLKGLQKLTEEYYRLGKTKDAEKTLKKAVQIAMQSMGIDK